MKTKILLLLIPLALFSCTPNTSNTLSEKEMSQATAEIKSTAGHIFSDAEKIDLDAALSYFADSPDFAYLINGTSLNYEEMVKGMKPVFDSMSDQTFNVLKEKISFPCRTVAFYTAQGINLMHYKNGITATLDPYVLFFAFKKIDNHWKVIYGAESYVEKLVEKKDMK